MPNTKSARKMLRVSHRKREANKPVRSRVKTYLTKAEKLIQSGEQEPAGEAVRQAISALDKAAQKKVVHPNNAARRKSRLMSKLNSALATVPPSKSSKTRKTSKTSKSK